MIAAICAGVVTWGKVNGDIRSIILFGFVLFCPGMSFVHLLQIKDHLAEFVLSITLSLTLSTILAEVMILARLWHPSTELGVLIGLSLLGSVFQVKAVLQAQRARPKAYVSLHQ
jgi:uncharacterized membrane protein